MDSDLGKSAARAIAPSRENEIWRGYSSEMPEIARIEDQHSIFCSLDCTKERAEVGERTLCDLRKKSEPACRGLLFRESPAQNLIKAAHGQIFSFTILYPFHHRS